MQALLSDAVGVVRPAAEDGTGPAPGTRVATLMTGNAWAQVRAVRRLGALTGRGLLVTGLDQVSALVHGVIDSVGGPLLAQAFGLLAEGGVIQQAGASSGPSP